MCVCVCVCVCVCFRTNRSLKVIDWLIDQSNDASIDKSFDFELLILVKKRAIREREKGVNKKKKDFDSHLWLLCLFELNVNCTELCLITFSLFFFRELKQKRSNTSKQTLKALFCIRALLSMKALCSLSFTCFLRKGVGLDRIRTIICTKKGAWK